MALPSISLAIIAKNEEKNLPRLFKSIEGCFDEIIVVDTGSTDRTKLVALEYGAKVFDFQWINDFSAARNHALSKCTKDYVMWLDCDDALKNREGFIQWKTHAMEFTDIAFATYNYALNKDGSPIISFVRERVFRRSLNPEFKYKIHEGVIIKPEWSKDYAVTWAVDHHRDEADIKADKSRNVTILEDLKNQNLLDARLQFYYGKELYEANRSFDALREFNLAIARPDLDINDRILAYQYAAYTAMTCGDSLKPELQQERLDYYQKSIQFCLEGIRHDPNRAEYHCAAGDTYLKLGDLLKAVPYYSAAKGCINPKASGSAYEGAIYSFLDCYGQVPQMQLAKVYFNLGKLAEAKKEAEECHAKYSNPEALEVLAEIKRIQEIVNLNNNQAQTEDIVFTCPPQTAYPFDEEIYKTKPLGGSETALVSMAKQIKELTGRTVKVFNMRESEEDLIAESGVEYISNKKLTDYFSKNLPRLHIAWRHNIELTRAKTYLWCHDLVTSTVESKQNFDKIICLTNFHKNYVMAKQGVSDKKIFVSRNGINLEKLHLVDVKNKNPNKLVWMSSPDRGLDRAMLVCDEVKKSFPDIELHVYYGLDNLYKYGMSALADKLKAMMEERPYVKYHGFTEQGSMYKQVADAVCWVHPCNFIETFCITALEMLDLRIYPVTRRLGALVNTLQEAEQNGWATMLDHDCTTAEEIKLYAQEVCAVLEEKKYESISFDGTKHTWTSVAHEWIKEMKI